MLQSKTSFARGYTNDSNILEGNFRNQIKAVYGEGTRTNTMNTKAVSRYYKGVGQYRGVDKLINHYHNHWNRSSYFERNHTENCPCCFLISFELSRDNGYLRRKFDRTLHGRNNFHWHYWFRWDRGSPVLERSLDRYARLTYLTNSGDVSDDDSDKEGFAYFEDGEQRIINFHGKETYDFRSSAVDPNDVESIPTWLGDP